MKRVIITYTDEGITQCEHEGCNFMEVIGMIEAARAMQIARVVTGIRTGKPKEEPK